ncbi:MAG: cyclic lactone autoinducer peptide [Syntrophomonas sp.]
MKNFKFRFSGLLVAALVFIAQVSPMCVFLHYQSEVPASLRK